MSSQLHGLHAFDEQMCELQRPLSTCLRTAGQPNRQGVQLPRLLEATQVVQQPRSNHLNSSRSAPIPSQPLHEDDAVSQVLCLVSGESTLCMTTCCQSSLPDPVGN